jgi:uncharacterized protein (UPF0261 family)
MSIQSNNIYVVTTFDTKSAEACYIRELILATGLTVTTVDLSTKSFQDSDADITPSMVAQFHPEGADAVFSGDRGKAMIAMATAFNQFMLSRTDVGGIIGLGGSGGTALITPAMQSLPIGLPKLMVSTMASGDVSNYVGSSDISMLYSVTDIAGLNRISRQVLANAAHSIVGAVKFQAPIAKDEKPALGLTMFGVTTPCIQQLSAKLNDKFDCLVFHATGTGGAAMEKLADSGLLNAVLDMTTTEICDMMFGGVLACTPDRLDAFARTKLPYIGSCGALDMVNFGNPSTIPERYKDRLFYPHNPQVTLMRTTPEENRQMGIWIGEKLNACEGEVRFFIPEGGVSALDAPDQSFWSPESDKALFDALTETIKQTDKRRLIRLPYHINDAEFVQAVFNEFNQLWNNQ